mgnify:CR=1 FL=1
MTDSTDIYQDQPSKQLEYLMRRFGKQVVKLAYYHLRDRHLAEDIAQEVFCRVYQNLDTFRHDSSYYTWIYRITVNLCRDYIRSAYSRRVFTLDNAKHLESGEDPIDRLLERIEGGEVFQKVMDLPIKYRMVTVLYYFEEMSTVEISRILDIGESTVRTRLCRARKMLKDVLSGEAGIIG